jgi:hypothetical protein
MPHPFELCLFDFVLSSSACSDYMDVPELSPRHDLVGRIADLEHKARRSLMHRCEPTHSLLLERQLDAGKNAMVTFLTACGDVLVLVSSAQALSFSAAC